MDGASPRGGSTCPTGGGRHSTWKWAGLQLGGRGLSQLPVGVCYTHPHCEPTIREARRGAHRLETGPGREHVCHDAGRVRMKRVVLREPGPKQTRDDSRRNETWPLEAFPRLLMRHSLSTHSVQGTIVGTGDPRVSKTKLAPL